MSNMGVSVGSWLFSISHLLMIAERTLAGLVHPQKIEKMSKELTEVIEDFDRAMNVEALRQAKDISTYSLISI